MLMLNRSTGLAGSRDLKACLFGLTLLSFLSFESCTHANGADFILYKCLLKEFQVICLTCI